MLLAALHTASHPITGVLQALWLLTSKSEQRLESYTLIHTSYMNI